MRFVPPLNQIAFSVVDLRVTERWFREGFGFLPAGGSRPMMRGLLPSRVQGLPRAASTCWWLVGRNEWCQLEFLQFERPMAKLMRHDFRPCDIGYTRVGCWVADFDATLARLARLGTLPLAAPLGEKGARRACVRSPDGVYVEIMEDEPLPEKAATTRSDCPVAIRSITLSVPNLTRSAAFLGGAIGLAESSAPLHLPQHEALWGLTGATTKRKVFVAGDVLVEVVQYADPAGKPWPDGYRVSDQGIVNIAFGTRHKRDHMEVYQRTVEAGALLNCSPIHIPGSGVVYVNDAQGFSVEILWMKPGKADRNWGFLPLPIERRPQPDTRRIEQRIRIAAPIEKVWAVVSDHEGMAAWSGFKPVTRIVDGAPDPNGYGAERRMVGPTGTVVEQVLAWDPPHGLRYRVIKGSPFICHQGEIQLESRGAETELIWTIRFRPKVPGTGGLLRMLLDRMLAGMLNRGLKPLVERR